MIRDLSRLTTLMVLGLACRSETAPVRDVTPPNAVSDLAVSDWLDRSLMLTWTAPGDDGFRGQASSYSIRCRPDSITEDTWNAAPEIPYSATPQATGHQEHLLVSDLTEGTWYFALRSSDDAGNASGLSNIARGWTGDTVPPAMVSDLFVQAHTRDAVTLQWTAPGNDDMAGRALTYDLRYDSTLITEQTWNQASPVSGMHPPADPGASESFTVGSLPVGETCYFGLKTADARPNWSLLSNIVSVTLQDLIPPNAVSDLNACSSAAGTVVVSWTAPGNDDTEGQASAYDLRYSPDLITTATWDMAQQVPSLPVPAASGTSESVAIHGLSSGATYWFALKSSDGMNWSTLSNAIGISVASSIVRVLTGNPGSGIGAQAPTWSPDGSQIAFFSDCGVGQNFEICRVSKACGATFRLTDDLAGDRFPAWSPTGEAMAFLSDRNEDIGIWMMNSDGSNPRPLVTGDVGEPAFSPDGTHIAFSMRTSLDPPMHEIDVISASGGPRTQVVEGSSINVGPTYSPDGTEIAFSSTRTGNYEIWIARLDGAPPIQLTSNPAVDYAPTWSPDGSHIAFASNRTGSFEIWIVGVEGGEPDQVTFDSSSNLSPAWSPDGREIAYQCRKSGVYQIQVVTLR